MSTETEDFISYADAESGETDFAIAALLSTLAAAETAPLAGEVLLFINGAVVADVQFVDAYAVNGSTAAATDQSIPSTTVSPVFVSRARATDRFLVMQGEFVTTAATAVDVFTPSANVLGGSVALATDVRFPSNTLTLLGSSHAAALDRYVSFAEVLLENVATASDTATALVQSVETSVSTAISVDAAVPSNTARPILVTSYAVATDVVDARQTMDVVYSDAVLARTAPVPSIPMGGV